MPDALVAEVAAKQHGVVATKQLLAAGFNKDGIQRRLKADPPRFSPQP